eukprot:jgi/Chlat1/1642/Chrsp127S01892
MQTGLRAAGKKVIIMDTVFRSRIPKLLLLGLAMVLLYALLAYSRVATTCMLQPSLPDVPVVALQGVVIEHAAAAALTARVYAVPPMTLDDVYAAMGDHIYVNVATWGFRLLALNLRASMLRIGITNLCFFTVDTPMFDLLASLRDGPVCVIHATKVFGYAHSNAHDRPLSFRGGDWDELQLLKYAPIREGLRRGMSVTFTDNDIVVLKDTRPVFDQHFSACPITVYCCHNVGYMHFQARYANETIEFLDKFTSRIRANLADPQAERLFNQDTFVSMARDADMYCEADAWLGEGDGCHRWRFMQPQSERHYVFHAQCVSGTAYYLKIALLQSLHCWFLPRPLGEQYLTYANPALLDDSLPAEFEVSAFARAIGLAIALNRTLIAPHMRCVLTGKGYRGRHVTARVDHHYFQFAADGHCPLVTYSGLASYKELITNHIMSATMAHTGSMPQAFAECIHGVGEQIVPLRGSAVLTDPQYMNMFDVSSTPWLSVTSNGSELRVVGDSNAQLIAEQRVTHADLASASCLCAEQLLQLFHEYQSVMLMRINGCLPSVFCGFTAGSDKDVRYKSALSTLALSKYYSAC